MTARRLFILLALMTASLHVVLLVDHRLPRRHRTRQHYELQYSLLSGCAQPGAVPLWLPYAAQGVVSNPALFSTSGLVSSPLMLAGRSLDGADQLLLFHLGVFMEELVLLLGCWLLALRLFGSPIAAFFTGVAALGSAFWLDEMELNVHSIFALPLLLELLHRWLSDGSRSSLLLAANLALVQSLGAPPGAGLVAPIAAILVLAARSRIFKDLPLRKPDWKSVLAGIAAGVPVLVTAFGGTHDLARLGDARPLAWSDALVYSGLSNPLRALDFATGLTPSLDWSVYCGALTLGFAIVALLRPGGLRLAAAAVGGLLLFGGLLFLIFCWVPALRPARPLPYGIPIARLFVVFLAGSGVRQALEARDPRPLRSAARLLIAGSLGAVILSATAALNPDAVRNLMEALVAGEPSSSASSAALQPWVFPAGLRASLVPDCLGASALLLALSGGLLFLLGGRTRNLPIAWILILVLHPLDAFGWKFRLSWLESFPANPVQQQFQHLERTPFVARRIKSIAESPRYLRFHESIPYAQNPEYAPRNSDSWPSAGYWQTDPMEAPGSVEYWMRTRTTAPAVAEKLQVLDRDRHPTGRIARVSGFEPNAVEIAVEGAPEDALLVYADSWDSGWSATVNGKPREIERTGDGDKMVRLDGGTNRLEFRYSAPLRTIAGILVGINMLFWLVWSFRTAGFLAVKKEVPA